mmetsp:Transcript_69366/g.184681  ORF Transcript_69366/g.184681 Transcript_69366/m.184681 type:complete len:110 (+) Transcript_69366:17-346(+)|eukprot:4811130-Prymnesium_polylepis.1
MSSRFAAYLSDDDGPDQGSDGQGVRPVEAALVVGVAIFLALGRPAGPLSFCALLLTSYVGGCVAVAFFGTNKVPRVADTDEDATMSHSSPDPPLQHATSCRARGRETER